MGVISLIEVEFGLINHILETNYIFHELRIDKNSFTDSIARNYFAFIGLTCIKVGTFITRTHTEMFLENVSIIEMLKNNGKSELTDVDKFLEYIYSFKTEKAFDLLERAILDEYVRRKMTDIAEMLVEMSEDRKISSSEILRKASLQLDKLLYQQSTDLVSLSASDIVKAELEQIQSGEVQEYTPTGINIIDDFTGGVPSPALIVPLAATKRGKSMLLYKMMLTSLMNGKNVLLCTIETGDVETRKKLMSLYTGIEYMKISKMAMTKEELDIYKVKLIEFEELYQDHIFLMYNNGGMSTKDIEIYYEKYKRTGVIIDSMFIDYMGLLKDGTGKKGKADALLDLPLELRILSQKTNTVVVCPQQLHSAVANLDIEEINESKIFYISTLAHEATVTLVLHCKDGEDDTKIKVLRSRVHHTSDVYWFPSKDFDKCNIGEDVKFEDYRFI